MSMKNLPKIKACPCGNVKYKDLSKLARMQMRHITKLEKAIEETLELCAYLKNEYPKKIN